MKENLIQALGLDADATEAEILEAVKTLVRVSNSPGAKMEKAVREKVAAGLSREAAIQVLKDQAADDELRAERDLAAEEARREAQAKKTEWAPAK